MSNILVIGGTKGIGAALVRRLVNQHQVFVWARTATDIEGVQVTVNNPVDSVPDTPGLPEVVDAVVYCPGSINLKPFARLSAEDFLQDFSINVVGAVRSLQLLTPRLKKSPQASVVLFSSVAATCGMPYHASIAASKAAVEGLVRSLAAEWAPYIRINAIAPSLTATPLTEKLTNSPEKIEAAAKRHPLQRIGDADEMAALAEFLISPSAAFITGQIVAANGGLGQLRI